MVGDASDWIEPSEVGTAAVVAAHSKQRIARNGHHENSHSFLCHIPTAWCALSKVVWTGATWNEVVSMRLRPRSSAALAVLYCLPPIARCAEHGSFRDQEKSDGEGLAMHMSDDYLALKYAATNELPLDPLPYQG